MSSTGYGYNGDLSDGDEVGSVSSSVYFSDSAPLSSSTASRPQKRAQVKNACVNCQRACKKCDNARPCHRCVKHNLLDTCVDSVRKPRKKGIKRGPYKKRKRASLADLPTSFPRLGQVPVRSTGPAVDECQLMSPPRSLETAYTQGRVLPIPITHAETDKTGLHRDIPSGSSERRRRPRLQPPAGFRLPPIGSFDSDSSPPPRPLVSSNSMPQSQRALSERPPLRVNVQGAAYSATKMPTSPLNMLSDVAVKVNPSRAPVDKENIGTRLSTPPLQQPFHRSLRTNPPRLNSYFAGAKHIPLSSSRFDCSYRAPSCISDSSSPTSHNPSPAMLHARPLNANAKPFAMEGQKRVGETDLTCTRTFAEVQVRRLSNLLDQSHINQQ